MASDPYAPEFILAAIKRIYPELPILIGKENWGAIGPTIHEHISEIENAEKPEHRILPSTKLFGCIEQYEPARKRLISELKIQEIISENISAPFTLYSSDHQVLGQSHLNCLRRGL